MQTLLLDTGGSVETDFLEATPTSAVATLYSGQADDTATESDGSASPEEKASAVACTVSTISTTLSSAAAAGDDTIVVASATGVKSGRKIRIGSADDDVPYEDADVKRVEGTSVILWSPLLYDHASASAVKGTKVTVVITDLQCDEVWSDGYVVFTPAPTTISPRVERVACTRTLVPLSLCSLGDVRQAYPQIAEKLDPRSNVPAMLRDARDNLLTKLGRDFHLYAIPDASLRRAAALEFLLQARYQFGEPWKETADQVEKDLNEMIETFKRDFAFDVDQDGKTREVGSSLDGTDDVNEILPGWGAA